MLEASAGSEHSGCIARVADSTSVVYTWGSGENGRLGLGDTAQRMKPSAVLSLRKVRTPPYSRFLSIEICLIHGLLFDFLLLFYHDTALIL